MNHKNIYNECGAKDLRFGISVKMEKMTEKGRRKKEINEGN